MADYTTPPTLSPNVQSNINSLLSVTKANYDAIARSLINKALSAARVTSPKISVDSVYKLIKGTVRPMTSRWEGGWGNHPNDSGGATMRGVTLGTFVGSYDDIFIKTGIQAVKSVAQSVDNNLRGWRNANGKGGAGFAIASQMLYLLLKDEDVAALWTILFYCSSPNRYPIAISTEDPYLGFILYDMCWGSGASGTWDYKRIDQLSRSYGWNGVASSFPSWAVSLGDRTPQFALDCLKYSVDHIIRISKPGSKNAVFRKGWLNRCIFAPFSQVDALVIINENFNLNKKGIYNFTQPEIDHLARKAAIYKTLELNFPNL